MPAQRASPRVPAPERQRLHVLAVALAVATFVLMIAGSLVHGTGSSLACPDWPLCYGQFFPEMRGGVEFEHTHRIIAGCVAIATVVLAVLGRRDPAIARLGVFAVALVLVQALLGGLTVLWRLPAAVSIAHLGTSMCFLSTTVVAAVRTAPGATAAGDLPADAARARRWIAAAAVIVLAQAVLGALVRHTWSGLACPDVPLCTGRLWPDAWPQRVHALHRFGAVGVLALVPAACVALRRRAPPGAARSLAVLPAAVLVVQVALGVALVLAALPLWLITVHHATGALLLASLVLVWALSARPTAPG